MVYATCMNDPIVVNERQQAFNGKVYVRHRRGYYHHNITYLHRAVWEATHGPIPPGRPHHIHHEDGDKSNNALGNLRLKAASDHLREHMTPERRAQSAANMIHAQAAAPAWHRSAEGRQWHSDMSKDAWTRREPRQAVCDRCAAPYEVTGHGRFCSPACRAAATRDRRAAGEAPDPRRQTLANVAAKDRTCTDCGAVYATKSARKKRCETCQREVERVRANAAYAARAATADIGIGDAAFIIDRARSASIQMVIVDGGAPYLLPPDGIIKGGAVVRFR